ncbi:MAG: 16S rRNA (cytosine(1402)-N(4))-methyltransferase RsmH [Elusimicrobiaceae bacterium]|nr:16S rRNA (cytosine(1402)-N(4))-methyltransferase RsmH [Elusimicrobiaceae bacterium]
MTQWTHKSVLLKETADLLVTEPGGIYLDGTLGLGGHSEYLLRHKLSAEGRILGIDWDCEAAELASAKLAGSASQIIIEHGSYTQAPEILERHGIAGVSGALFDLGLSSYQLENPAKGFSFMHDGPLDMRYNTGTGKTAAELLNTADYDELVRILEEYGEERFAARIADKIVDRRAETPFASTAELRNLVRNAVPRHGRIHPATKTFQALRIAVNAELENVVSALAMLDGILLSGGRAAFITFHSTEDRIVKYGLRGLAEKHGWKLLTKKAVKPSRAEILENPRSRSAKLRVIEKLDYRQSAAKPYADEF